jgi:Uma2 family endonuclease
MGQPQLQKENYTFEEYLALEQETGVRFEFYQGEVFAMAGGTLRHNRIGGNIFVFLRGVIENRPYDVFQSDLKLEMKHLSHYVYPDIMFTCHPDDLKDEEAIFIPHPSLIVEVLSKSTGGYDLNEKRDKYFKIPDLQYYMIVWQTKYKVELYARRNQFWAYYTFEEIIDILDLDAI